MEPDPETEVSPEAVLAAVASQTGLTFEELGGERSLTDLGVSSFGVMRLVLALEELFDMEFSGRELRAFTTVPVPSLYELVQQAKAPSPD
jgi:acyl carrier protein